ncbi:MAG TPA: N-acetylglucosamine-6-phosphate deacetylase, partial [Phenylobacterium sp.]|nr:N-acetylglucosamine-6-phosphate deacetylase [Phenylobacterium sp.]
MAEVLINGRVLTPRGLEAATVVIEGERIAEVRPAVAGERGLDLAGGYLLPGFIDAQVNGGGGALFTDTPTVAAIATIGAAHRRFGTTGFLPTLISDDLAAVATAIGAVDEAIAAGAPGVLGIHIEGPFLSSDRKGIHDASKFR